MHLRCTTVPVEDEEKEVSSLLDRGAPETAIIDNMEVVLSMLKGNAYCEDCMVW